MKESTSITNLLSQFDKSSNWVLMKKDLIDKGGLDYAIDNGFIEVWKGVKGSTYHETLRLTLHGRAYLIRTKNGGGL